MVALSPTLGDLWPYREAAVPPELASVPVDLFLCDPKGSSIVAAQWTTPVDPEAAPRAAYALRLTRDAGRGTLAQWDGARGLWQTVRRFAMAPGAQACSILELHGILLGNVQTPEALGDRLKALLQDEFSMVKTYRLTSRVLSVLSIVVLFFAVRNGVESHAVEPFALIFALAAGIGLLAAGLRTRCKSLQELAVGRMREQFQFEYRQAEHSPLTLRTLTQLMQERDRKGEEEAIIFGFLLLLCFVYFISTLVVVGVIVAVIVVTLMIGDVSVMRLLGVAHERAENRLEHSFLSFRATDDAFAPPALRQAKRQVLRDRIRRYGDMLAKVQHTQTRLRLTQDVAVAVAFLIIFAAYAFPIAAGFQKLSVTKADSLVVTSLFSVAPVIILLSISKSTVSLAQILNRKLLALSR